MLTGAEDAIVQLINDMLENALEKRASDIHVEPEANACRVRLRVDGLLCVASIIPKELEARVITRLKMMAGLDIAEKRLPQDGQLKFMHQKNNIHCRMSTCSTVQGEKIALRILYESPMQRGMDELGMTAEQLMLVKKMLAKPQGLILVTGPTGSGKTISLYSFLSFINTVDKNIVTVEDPVEMLLPGVNQLSINIKATLTFEKALRAFLRQDPDVIMIGEIRDVETAKIALRAALTGHLVLATLHANNTLEAIARLVSLGVDALSISNALILIIAQRLIRKKCAHGVENYSERTGIFECLPITEAFRFDILQQKQLVMPNHIETLGKIAQQKVREGLTSPEEILRVMDVLL